MAMLAASVEVVIGVDTHKHTHTAAVLAAATGQTLAITTRAATPAGYRQLLELADQHPRQRVWAIKGAGGYGAGLTRFLAAHQEQVVELDRPKRAHRRHGAKSDPPDATLRSLARRIRELTTEAADHRQAILELVRAWRPDLLGRTGVGPIVAATVLCAWSHAGRCRSDAAFAMWAGPHQFPPPLARRCGFGSTAPATVSSIKPCTPWS
jgi:transposase